MRNETWQTRVGDPDASPGWYDDDVTLAPLPQPRAPTTSGTLPRATTHGSRVSRASGRPATKSPYATRQFVAVRPRPPVHARPLRADSVTGEQTLVLPATTRRLPVVEPVQAPAPARPAHPAPVTPGISPALRAFTEAPTGKQRALPRGVTIVPGNGRALRRPTTWGMSRRAHSNWVLRSGAALILVASLIALVRVVSVPSRGPLSFDSFAAAAGQAPIVSTPMGRGVAGANAADAIPNPWQAVAYDAPVLGGGGAAAPGALAAATPVPPPPTATPHASAPKPTTAPASGVQPAPFTPWPPRDPWMAVPGHPAYRVYDYAGDPYARAFGQCTWWAQHERRDENLRWMGNARYWAAGAAHRGYKVSSPPAANATVVFQPYVQGASPVGHVGHVIAVYPNGWFLMSEMNAYGNGGGWGRVSFRYAHAGSGVQFIY